MKRTIYTKTAAFRITTSLREELERLADKANRHPSDLIRTAVWEFVRAHRDDPSALVKVA